MKLTDVIPYLIGAEQTSELYANQSLSSDSEAILMYMKEPLDLDSDVVLLSIEETEDEQVYRIGNDSYLQLFPVDYAAELIHDDLDLLGKGYSATEIASRLLEYRKYDA